MFSPAEQVKFQKKDKYFSNRLVGKCNPLTFATRSRAAVARRAHNPKVTGSIPVFATKDKKGFLFYETAFFVYRKSRPEIS